MVDISVVCKRCGKTAKSSEFVLDPIYKMAVCPACVKDRKDKEKQAEKARFDEKGKQKQQEALKGKPAGWDYEDDYLEHAEKKKNDQKPIQFEKIGAEKVMVTCPKCTYKFKFNTIKKVPKSCPYCGRMITPR